MGDCEHDFDAFRQSYDTATPAWAHAECALCMLRLLDDLHREYANCYPAATQVLQNEKFMEIGRALRTFVSLVAVGKFDGGLIPEQLASSHPADTLDMATAVFKRNQHSKGSSNTKQSHLPALS